MYVCNFLTDLLAFKCVQNGDQLFGERSNERESRVGFFAPASGDFLFGEYKSKTGLVHFGEFPQGYGQQTSANKVNIRGQFINMMPQGFCNMQQPEAQISYQGQVSNGLYHGYGIQTTPVINRQEAHWKGGRINGFAIFEYKDGRIYKGEVSKTGQDLGYAKSVNDEHLGFVNMYSAWIQQQAQGAACIEFIQADGHVSMRYSGELKTGKMHGLGILTRNIGEKDESTFIGQFENNVMHGYGILIDSEYRKSMMQQLLPNEQQPAVIDFIIDNDHFINMANLTHNVSATGMSQPALSGSCKIGRWSSNQFIMDDEPERVKTIVMQAKAKAKEAQQLKDKVLHIVKRGEQDLAKDRNSMEQLFNKYNKAFEEQEAKFKQMLKQFQDEKRIFESHKQNSMVMATITPIPKTFSGSSNTSSVLGSQQGTLENDHSLNEKIKHELGADNIPGFVRCNIYNHSLYYSKHDKWRTLYENLTIRKAPSSTPELSNETQQQQQQEKTNQDVTPWQFSYQVIKLSNPSDKIAQEHLNVIQNYYLHRDSAKLANAIIYMMQREEETSSVNYEHNRQRFAFLIREVVRDILDVKQLRQFVDYFVSKSSSSANEQFIYEVLQHVNYYHAKLLLRERKRTVHNPIQQQVLQPLKLSQGSLLEEENEKLKDTDSIDMLWMYYYATGSLDVLTKVLELVPNYLQLEAWIAATNIGRFYPVIKGVPYYAYKTLMLHSANHKQIADFLQMITK